MSSTAYAQALSPSDSLLLNKYATPVPPTPASLLEDMHREVLLPQGAADHRNSLLLDMNDALGMQLLLSSATIDSQDFKLLSFEEVERLKREKALLQSRIEAHTRKLALESKVRDASQNLVRLHANKNKRLSKQAEDQLNIASRKVEDLATDLWRLQRRESTIIQQLLEHMAGVFARNVNDMELVKKHEAYLDFDDEHLYHDSTMSQRTSISLEKVNSQLRAKAINGTAEGIPNTHEAVTESVSKAEAKLRETNGQIQKLLAQPLAWHDEQSFENRPGLDDAGSDLESQLKVLDASVNALQERLLQHHATTLDRTRDMQAFNLRLWNHLDTQNTEFSEAALESTLARTVKDLNHGRLNWKEAESRSADLEEMHGKTMKQLQAEYEKELDDVHSRLESLHDDHENLKNTNTMQASLYTESQKIVDQHQAQLNSVQAELAQAHQSAKDVSTREVGLKEELASYQSKITSLQLELSNVHTESSTSRQVTQSAVADAENKIKQLQSVIARKDAELVIKSDKLDLMKLELQAQDMKRDSDYAAMEAQNRELETKHVSVNQNLLSVTSARDEIQKELAQVRALANAEAESLKQELQQAASRIQKHEESAKQYRELERQDMTVQTLQSDIAKMTDEKLHIHAELNALKETHLENDRTLVQDLERKLTDLEAELQKALDRNDVLEATLVDRESKNKLAAHAAQSEREEALDARCNLLQKELDSMLLEYEAMTRSALFHESERTKLENRADKLHERVLTLETDLADEKIKSIGIEQNSRTSADEKYAEPISTAGLRKEFRKLVQELRVEHANQAKADYAEIKRLERMIASVKEKSLLTMQEQVSTF